MQPRPVDAGVECRRVDGLAHVSDGVGSLSTRCTELGLAHDLAGDVGYRGEDAGGRDVEGCDVRVERSLAARPLGLAELRPADLDET